MNIEKIPLLNTYYHNLSMSETLAIIKEAIDSKNQIHHSDINATKIAALQKDLELRESVNSSDLINIDGQAVLWAAKFLNKPTKERVSGIDLMINLVELASKNNYKIFLLGAKQEVVETLANLYTQKYGQNLVAGYRNGYFSPEEENSVVNEIVNSKADILFVAMTSPKKEIFLHKYKNELSSVSFIMGVGGSFDVIAGFTKRAPIWMQKMGLEWFFRVIQEPKRLWKRYLFGNFNFIKLVLAHKLRS